MADLADLVNKLARVDGFYGSVHDFFGHEFKPLSNLFDEDECADLVRLFENPTDLGYYAFWNELADYMKHSRALDCLEQALGITVETEDVCAKLEEVGFKSRKGFGLLRMGFAFSTTLLTGLRRYQSQFYSVMKYHKDFYRSVSGLVETLNSLDPSLREDIFEFYSGLGGDFRIKLEAMIEMAKLGKERPLDLGFLMQIAPE
ncbi:hypothetical protein KY328_01605, partial [Candidatus Woesearchaeota archaeon]|nr:hypothetical protein [Candidatus Woesearchaeota archaeon]